MLPATLTLRKALLARIAVLGLAFFLSWPSAAQPSQKLSEPNDHLSRADERRFLDYEENDAVAHMPGQLFLLGMPIPQEAKPRRAVS